MRSPVPAMLAVVLLASGCGPATGPTGTSAARSGRIVATSAPDRAETTSPGDRVTTARACRRQWSDLASLHGENGDPGAAVAELSRRWERLYDRARRRAGTADAADCGRSLESYAARWDGLERLMYGLDPFDLAQRLAYAEADRRHALARDGVDRLSPRLERQFRRARRNEDPAATDLTPALAAAPDVRVTARGAVAGFVAQVEQEAEGSAAYRAFDRALDVIGRAELSEE